MFSESKVTQMAAYLLARAGGAESYLKLMKLLYLVDRESMRETGDTMSHDHLVSMPQGPVLSQTLDLLTNGVRSQVWASLIGPAPDYSVKLLRPTTEDDFDELSAFDRQTLDAVYGRFGHMDRWQLRDWTHDPKNCPEWRDPRGSSFPIKPEHVFGAFGDDEATSRAKALEIKERRETERLMSQYS
jgi:uncharacterized phage-associated protein